MAKYLRDRELFFKEGHPTTIEGDSVLKVGFKRLTEGATIPTKAHATDSGFDLYASEDVIIEPGETAVVPTGIAVQLPAGHEAQVRPRSGVTSRTKLRVQLGTIDEGYGGEIGVIVDNTSSSSNVSVEDAPQTWLVRGIDEAYEEVDSNYDVNCYIVNKGDRLAQLVVQPLPAVEAYEIEDDVKQTERGAGGFGSTGV